jgi:glutaredoxin
MKRIISIVLVIAALLIVGCTGTTSGSSTGSTATSLAKCLTEKKVVMYGTEWCSYCKMQKKDFGTSFKDVTFVDCDKEKAKCQAAGVTGYPTWKINGKNYPGKQSLSTLASLSGCKA